MKEYLVFVGIRAAYTSFSPFTLVTVAHESLAHVAAVVKAAHESLALVAAVVKAAHESLAHVAAVVTAAHE